MKKIRIAWSVATLTYTLALTATAIGRVTNDLRLYFQERNAQKNLSN